MNKLFDEQSQELTPLGFGILCVVAIVIFLVVAYLDGPV